MAATGVILDRLEQNLTALIAGLNLQGTPGTTPDVGANVYRQMLPEQLNIQLPAVLVTSFGEESRPSENGESFETVGTAFPIRVMILDAAGPYPQAREGDYLAWNHTLRLKFEDPGIPAQLADCPELWWIEVAKITQIDPRLPESQWFQAGVLLTCHVSEARPRS